MRVERVLARLIEIVSFKVSCRDGRLFPTLRSTVLYVLQHMDKTRTSNVSLRELPTPGRSERLVPQLATDLPFPARLK